MSKIEPKKVLSYAVLPEIFPRIRELFGTSFSSIAFLVAHIFYTCGLLPKGHPYLNNENYGKYSTRQVFAQAASRLVFDRKHLDQVAIFGILLVGFVLLFLQIVLLVVSLVTDPVMAGQDSGFVGMFGTPYPERDIALSLMDKVFGIPNFFNTEYNPANGPLPFHQALQGLFGFYSTALLLLGVIIFLYFVFVIIAETVQSGTPFGRRFAHAWVPIRLVVALGLLIPLGYGYNTAQYVVLTAAKMGSGFATNGWYIFNESMTNALGVSNTSMVARPKIPETWPLVKAMMLVSTCREAYAQQGVQGIQPYLVRTPLMSEAVLSGTSTIAVRYADAVDFYKQGDVIIRFGIKDNGKFSTYPGGVFPLCGEVVIKTIVKVGNSDNYTIGPWSIQEQYYNTLLYLWSGPANNDFGVALAYAKLPKNTGIPGSIRDSAECQDRLEGVYSGINCEGVVKPEFVSEIQTDTRNIFETNIVAARSLMIANAKLAVPEELLARGWAGAGIWYNRIAEMNGAFFTATSRLPEMSLMPFPMQRNIEELAGQARNLSAEQVFIPSVMGIGEVRVGSDGDIEEWKHTEAIKVLGFANNALRNDDAFQPTEVAKHGNVLTDTLNTFFGFNGVFSLRENSDIHPLALLVGLGRAVIESAIANLLALGIFSSLNGFAQSTSNSALTLVGSIGESVTSTLAFFGLTVGFMLYYILPFMPFMYFFFAAGSWIKSIFEAMIGAPLWALAHLRIDGDGLPGEGAMQGYFLIFEIFIRPILTVFGLIGSLIIFAAMVKVLNEIFDLVVNNLAGHDSNPCFVTPDGKCQPQIDATNVGTQSASEELLKKLQSLKRSVIDEFFYTIVYTVIVYMLAVSCFKLIDQIPSKILRWMGAGVQTFADAQGDAQEGIKKYIAYGVGTMGNELGRGIKSAGNSAGRIIGGEQRRPDGDEVVSTKRRNDDKDQPQGQGRDTADGQGQGMNRDQPQGLTGGRETGSTRDNGPWNRDTTNRTDKAPGPDRTSRDGQRSRDDNADQPDKE